MSQPLVKSAFIQGFAELVLAYGGRPEKMLKEVGLSAINLIDDEHKISIKAKNDLLENAAAELNIPHFGMELAKRQSLRVFGSLNKRLVRAPTVGAAMNLMADNFAKIIDQTNVVYTQNDKTCVIRISTSHRAFHDSRVFLEHGLFLMTFFFRALTGWTFVPRSAFLPEISSNKELGELAKLPYPIGFRGEDIELYFDARFARQTIHPSACQSLVKSFKDTDPQIPQSIVDEVTTIVRRGAIKGHFDLNYTAEILHTTPRQLQRKLANKGSSFRYILESVRLELAQIYLSLDNARLIDIAFQLGYSDLSAFSRGFKRAVGLPPSQWMRYIQENQKRKDVKVADTTFNIEQFNDSDTLPTR